jgi:hypothetical protein
VSSRQRVQSGSPYEGFYGFSRARAALLDPRWLVEIEVEAVVGE